MSSEVALRLLLKGQKAMAAGLADVSDQTGELGKVADRTSLSAKKLSVGLDAVEKSGVSATLSSKALLIETKKVADAQQAAAAASAAAAKARIAAADALAEATAKQAAGDLDGAKAAKANADALTRQAAAARASATAMRASASAARDQVTAVKASAAATDMAAASAAGAGAAIGGRAAAFGALSRTGKVLGLTGLAVGGYAGYEGVKRVAGVDTGITQLGTLANVPKSQLNALRSFAINESPNLRETPGTIVSQMYRIASSSPGKPYSANTLESLTKGAAGLSVLAGSSADPAQVARVFGIIRANGGLGTTSPSQIAAIAAATIGSGDMTGGDLISALGTGGLAVNAARHKLSFLQLGGILAQEGDLGVNGSRAGNSLQHAISLLASPNKQASGIYGALGLNPTAVDQVMRTQGLTAGVAMLKSALNTGIKSGAFGSAATKADFMAQGYGAKQATKMAGQGNASLQDLALTRLFGGAKQSVPIISIFDALTRTNSKTAEIAKNATPGVYNAHLLAAKSTPQMQWQNFDLGVQKLENDLGLKLIPILEHTFSWLQKNEGAVKDVATVIGVLAIPAIAAWSASLAMRGVASLTNFTGAIRGTNTELAKTGGVAEAQVGGVSALGAAVMGVVAAIGIFELGKATGSHGAGGAVTAGLGGAVVGMIVGFSVAGPFGAALGAAGGALAGLAGHFDASRKSVSSVTLALQGYEQQLDALNGKTKSFKSLGVGATSLTNTTLENNPALTKVLSQYGVTTAQIVAFALHNTISPQLASLGNAEAQPGASSTLVASVNQLHILESAITASIANGFALSNVERGPSKTKGAGSSTTAEHDSEIHIHVHVKDKEIAHVVHKVDANALARR